MIEILNLFAQFREKNCIVFKEPSDNYMLRLIDILGKIETALVELKRENKRLRHVMSKSSIDNYSYQLNHAIPDGPDIVSF